MRNACEVEVVGFKCNSTHSYRIKTRLTSCEQAY